MVATPAAEACCPGAPPACWPLLRPDAPVTVPGVKPGVAALLPGGAPLPLPLSLRAAVIVRRQERQPPTDQRHLEQPSCVRACTHDA